MEGRLSLSGSLVLLRRLGVAGGTRPLQDPVTPPAWLDLGDQDGDPPARFLCAPDVHEDRVDQGPVRAVESIPSQAVVPVVPPGAEGGADSARDGRVLGDLQA